jgi:hypothetical protein
MTLKRRILATSLALLLLITAGAWIMHEFYVSLTEIRHNPVSERLEVSMRIFPDDLDRALLEDTEIQTQLATEREHPAADSLISDYLSEHLKIEINQKEIKLNYLGKEPEGNALWCYLESDPVPVPEEINIESTLLIYTLPEQVNIIQVYVGKWNKGLLLNKDKSTGILKPRT